MPANAEETIRIGNMVRNVKRSAEIVSNLASACIDRLDRLEADPSDQFAASQLENMLCHLRTTACDMARETSLGER